MLLFASLSVITQVICTGLDDEHTHCPFFFFFNGIFIRPFKVSWFRNFQAGSGNKNTETHKVFVIFVYISHNVDIFNASNRSQGYNQFCPAGVSVSLLFCRGSILSIRWLISVPDITPPQWTAGETNMSHFYLFIFLLHNLATNSTLCLLAGCQHWVSKHTITHNAYPLCTMSPARGKRPFNHLTLWQSACWTSAFEGVSRGFVRLFSCTSPWDFQSFNRIVFYSAGWQELIVLPRGICSMS